VATKLWHAAETPGPRPGAGDEAETQKADLIAAATPLQVQWGKGMALGDALHRLAASLKAPVPIVVDLEGLRLLGLDGLAPVPAAASGRPFWEAVGLIHVACPRVALLSTPERLRAWQSKLGTAADVGASLGPAALEAAMFGVDQSGSFASLARWLAVDSGSPSESPPSLPRAFADLAGPPPPDWTEWELVPGYPTDDSLTAFDASHGRIAGLLLAALWSLTAAWIGWRFRLARVFRIHLVAVALLSLGLLWLPIAVRDTIAFPVLCVELAAFSITFTIRTWAGRDASRVSRSTMIRPVAAALVGIGLCSIVAPVIAQGPRPSEPYRVYLAPGEEPGKHVALVTPDLLKKLDQMAARPAERPSGGVVVAAQYQGRVKDATAHVEARFDLYHFDDKSTFVLPLTGVNLQPGVFLDGAPVFPVAHKGGGFALPLRGKGVHRLTLAFEVRHGVVNDHHLLEFNVPKAAFCQLELNWLTPARGLHLLRGQGEEKIQPDKKGGATLKAQLGYEGTIKLRWPAAQAAISPKAVEVREAYFWDLRPATMGLTAAVQLGIAKGSLTQARFALPEGIEVRSVTVATRAGVPASAAAIRQWSVAGKAPFRQLVVDFTQPVSGTVPLLLEIVPRVVLVPGQLTLRLPTPLLGTTVEGVLAYRLEAMEGTPTPQNLSIATVRPGLFGETWAALALRDPPAVTEAASFRRTAATSALMLAVQPSHLSVTADLSWKVGLRTAELSARLRLSESDRDRSLIELELPPRFALFSVSGKHVHRWHQQGRMVQVWLHQPRRQVDLELRGWLDHPAGPGPTRFELLPLRVIGAAATASTVALEAQPGLKLNVSRLLHLVSAAKGDNALFSSKDVDYQASFTLEAKLEYPAGRAFTLVERRDDGIELTTALHLPPRAGEAQVTVSGWAGDSLRLEAPAPVAIKKHLRQGSKHVWTLQFPAGLPQAVTLTVHGRLNGDRPPDHWQMPVLQAEPFGLQDHWIGLRGLEPGAADAKDFQVIKDAEAAPDFPAPPLPLREATRVGKAKDMKEGLVLRFPSASPDSAVQVLLAEHQVSWGGAAWVHQLRLLTFVHSPGEVKVRLPEGAVGRAIMAGKRSFVPGTGECSIPLGGRPGPQTVQIFWSYPASAEHLASPRMDHPTVAGVEPAAWQSRLWLPSAYRLDPAPAALAERAAGASLQEAEAWMQLCALWAAAGATAEAQREQETFFQLLEQARTSLAAQEQAGEADAAQGKERADRLEQQNAELARKGGYTLPMRRIGISSALMAGSPSWAAGVPLVWPEGSNVRLVSLRDLDYGDLRSATEFVLLGMIALLLLSYLPRGLDLLRVMWPEAILAMALAGIGLGGVSLVGITLCGVAVVLRAIWIVLMLRRKLPTWFARGAPSTNKASPSNPSAPPAA
jgi:hypothetical protein